MRTGSHKHFNPNVHCEPIDLSKFDENIKKHEMCPTSMMYHRDFYLCNLCQKHINDCDGCVNAHIAWHNNERAKVFATTCLLLEKNERACLTMDCVKEIAHMVNETRDVEHTCPWTHNVSDDYCELDIMRVCSNCHVMCRMKKISPRMCECTGCNSRGFLFDNIVDFSCSLSGSLSVSSGVGISSN